MFEQTVFEDSPPYSGEIILILPIAPVSLQANRSKKDILTNAIRSVTKTAPFVLASDVKIHIEWRVHQQIRYESNKAPDVDNIIKPIFDALCGSEGLLIDDCQVQAVDCRWIDWTSYDEKTSIYIYSYDKHLWYLKKGLIFVHFWNGLCFPFDKNPYSGYKGTDIEWSKELLKEVNLIKKLVKHRDDFMVNVVDDYYVAKSTMPIKPVFHRSRVNDFFVIELDEFSKQLSADI